MKPPTEYVRLGTKAETLARLRAVVQGAIILPLQYATFDDWRRDRERTLHRLMSEPWATGEVIVRSSASGEDVPGSSQAGRYRTVPHVNSQQGLATAIDAVFASYGDPSSHDQVLVQPQLSDIRATGVASSIDASNGAPYRIINWSESSDAAAVTSGRGVSIRTWYSVSRSPNVEPLNQDIAAVIALIDELEELTDRYDLEIEFGFRGDGPPVLFQVRSLVASGTRISPPDHAAALRDIGAQIASMQRERPKMLGSRTLFGVMPDWNPAEMIGRRPRPLALSMYKTLITDRAWSEARLAYGYRDVSATPLMIDFYGLPYIDVRASFTSLIPAELPTILAARLVKHYIATLIEHPAFHDKVEFEIILSCYSPTSAYRLDALASVGFSASDRQAIADALRRLTSRMIAADGPWTSDLERLQQLHVPSMPRGADFVAASIRCVNNLLDVCLECGTRPFAGLARAGFVAVEFLNGLIDVGILSAEQKSLFLANLSNIASVLIEQFHTLTKEQFLARYGHLRPGTYDILSPRYDEDPDRYFDWSRRSSRRTVEPNRFELAPAQEQAIDRLLTRMRLGCDSRQLFRFMASAIKGREEAKFHFTRIVSEILQQVRLLGEYLGCSPDDMSYLDIGFIRSLRDEKSAHKRLLEQIDSGRERYEITRAITLPPLIVDTKDIWSFVFPDTEPNFVTQKRCLAPVADIASSASPEGAIAFIESADPGYDWLFTRNIAGLVTAYGGCNSHMAIRAIELGVPAAIGVGEARFQAWRTAALLELDAGNRCIRTLP